MKSESGFSGEKGGGGSLEGAQGNLWALEMLLALSGVVDNGCAVVKSHQNDH